MPRSEAKEPNISVQKSSGRLSALKKGLRSSWAPALYPIGEASGVGGSEVASSSVLHAPSNPNPKSEVLKASAMAVPSASLHEIPGDQVASSVEHPAAEDGDSFAGFDTAPTLPSDLSSDIPVT